MPLNPFRKRRTVKKFTAPKRVYKNPFFSRENFSDVLFRTLKIHYGFIILLIFGFGYLFFFSEIFQLNFIEVKGAEKISQEKIENYVQDELSKARFLVFRQSNYFILNEKSAAKNIKNNIQQEVALEQFTLRKKFPRTIVITLKEVTPSLTWFTAGKYYYLDKNGIVAQSVNEDEVNQNFPLIEDINNLLVSPQEQIISSNYLSSIPKIKESLDKINLLTDHFLIPELKCYPEIEIEKEKVLSLNSNENINSNLNTNSETNSNKNLNLNTKTKIEEECILKDKLKQLTDIRVQIKDAYQIIYDTSQDIEKQTSNLDLILKTTLKGKTQSLDYIDLRFENRIYWK